MNEAEPPQVVALKSAQADYERVKDYLEKMDEADPLRAILTIIARQAFTGELAHHNMESMERVVFGRIKKLEER